MDQLGPGGVLDLPAAGFTIANGDFGTGGFDLVKQGLADGHSDVIFLLFVAIGSGDAAAIGLNVLDFETGDEFQQVKSRQAHIVGAELAGGVIGQVGFDGLEVGFEAALVG